MSPRKWMTENGMTFTHCPVCERVVESLIAFKTNRVGFRPLIGLNVCARCVGSLTDKASRRCAGWLVDGLKKIYRTEPKCVIRRKTEMCIFCGISPLWDLCAVARSADPTKMVCPKCLAGKRVSLPYDMEKLPNGLHIVSCAKCMELYVITGTAKSWARAQQTARTHLHNRQRSALAQWVEWTAGTGPAPRIIQSGSCSLPSAASQGDDTPESPNDEPIMGWESFRCALLRRGGKGLLPLVLRLPD